MKTDTRSKFMFGIFFDCILLTSSSVVFVKYQILKDKWRGVVLVFQLLSLDKGSWLDSSTDHDV